MAYECLRTIRRGNESGKDASRCDEYIAKEGMPSLYSRGAPIQKLGVNVTHFGAERSYSPTNLDL